MTDDMYQQRYWEINKVLDEALGTEWEDGAGEGIVAEVRLLVTQRDEARAALAATKPVIDAAIAWRSTDVRDPDLWPGDERALIGAVDALLASRPRVSAEERSDDTKNSTKITEVG